MSTRPGRERYTPVQSFLACVRSFSVSEERAWINELDRIAEADDQLAGDARREQEANQEIQVVKQVAKETTF